MMTPSERIIAIELDEAHVIRRAPEIEHEREIALRDLLTANRFAPDGLASGPYRVRLGIHENRLYFHIAADVLTEPAQVMLPLSPFRRIVRDYFLICESYFQAVSSADKHRLEAIDMGRRGIHNEGADLLISLLDGKIGLDLDTARRLFTLICVLHIR